MGWTISSAWNLIVKDLEDTLRSVCKAVLQEPGVTASILVRRAQALHRMGVIFQEVRPSQTGFSQPTPTAGKPPGASRPWMVPPRLPLFSDDQNSTLHSRGVSQGNAVSSPVQLFFCFPESFPPQTLLGFSVYQLPLDAELVLCGELEGRKKD